MVYLCCSHYSLPLWFCLFHCTFAFLLHISMPTIFTNFTISQLFSTSTANMCYFCRHVHSSLFPLAGAPLMVTFVLLVCRLCWPYASICAGCSVFFSASDTHCCYLKFKVTGCRCTHTQWRKNEYHYGPYIALSTLVYRVQCQFLRWERKLYNIYHCIQQGGLKIQLRVGKIQHWQVNILMQ